MRLDSASGQARRSGPKNHKGYITNLLPRVSLCPQRLGSWLTPRALVPPWCTPCTCHSLVPLALHVPLAPGTAPEALALCVPLVTGTISWAGALPATPPPGAGYNGNGGGWADRNCSCERGWEAAGGFGVGLDQAPSGWESERMGLADRGPEPAP